MIPADELGAATGTMTASQLLQFLLREKFRGGCAATSSLRARSVVVLDMIAEIDRATPVIFCHASYVYPESVEYRDRIVRRLDLTNVRDPAADEAAPRPDDRDHFEVIRSEIWGGGEIESAVHLNTSLSNFDCWISAAYHRPYSETAAPRLIGEGRLLRVDPLSGWTREEVHRYLEQRDLPLHPRIIAPTYHY